MFQCSEKKLKKQTQEQTFLTKFKETITNC